MAVLQLETLYQRREMFLYIFGKKCISKEQTKHLFKRKTTQQTMKTRNKEAFEVIHAKTERLPNSTVPYTQLLNK